MHDLHMIFAALTGLLQLTSNLHRIIIRAPNRKLIMPFIPFNSSKHLNLGVRQSLHYKISPDLCKVVFIGDHNDWNIVYDIYQSIFLIENW
jgi:hypothetical protein